MTERRRYGLAAQILFQFLGGIIMFMLFWALFDATVTQWFDVAVSEGGQDLSTGAGWLRFTWTFGPAIMLTMVSMRLLSRAVFESRGGVA